MIESPQTLSERDNDLEYNRLLSDGVEDLDDFSENNRNYHPNNSPGLNGDEASSFANQSQNMSHQREVGGQAVQNSVVIGHQEITDLYCNRGTYFWAVAYSQLGDPEDARDAVQDTWISLLGKEIASPNALVSYAFRTVNNRSRDMLHHRSVVEKANLQPQPDMPSAEETALASMASPELRRALDQLPPQQQNVIKLRFLADKSIDMTAEILGLSPGTVKSHTARGLKSLRTFLQPYLNTL